MIEWKIESAKISSTRVAECRVEKMEQGVDESKQFRSLDDIVIESDLEKK